ncbi:hypothetical protein Tco_0820172 [Tanacetum coccineum]|uniref:Uncharacterized protein n=1 Tax=Tanacetum coccineum TaxID=301880 RepID=A0ABQ5A9M9_9ASTR
MSTSHISISSDFDNKSTSSFISYIILSISEAKDVASPTIVLDYVPDSDIDIKPFEALASQEHTSASDVDIELLEAPASPDYTPGSDTESEPSENDLEES